MRRNRLVVRVALIALLVVVLVTLLVAHHHGGGAHRSLRWPQLAASSRVATDAGSAFVRASSRS